MIGDQEAECCGDKWANADPAIEKNLRQNNLGAARYGMQAASYCSS
jgi:hypothetical protein